MDINKEFSSEWWENFFSFENEIQTRLLLVAVVVSSLALSILEFKGKHTICGLY